MKEMNGDDVWGERGDGESNGHGRKWGDGGGRERERETVALGCQLPITGQAMSVGSAVN